jgi:hypothetical protein
MVVHPLDAACRDEVARLDDKVEKSAALNAKACWGDFDTARHRTDSLHIRAFYGSKPVL